MDMTTHLGRRRFVAGLAVAGTALGSAGLAGCRTAGATGRTAPLCSRATPLSAGDLEDALVGSSYLGCGGGGSLGEARELIARDLADGFAFARLDAGDLRDEDRVACPYALGSTAPESEAARARLAGYERVEPDFVQRSFALLQEHLGERFAAVILGEIGPLSMAEGLSTAARLGVPALDADTCGRAVPEIDQHSVRVAGLSLLPASGVTPLGDEMVLTRVADPSRPEDVFRAVSTVSELIGVVDSPLTGAQARRPGVLVRGSLSLAMRIGAAARAGGIDAARMAGGGHTLFEGEVRDWEWEDSEGFLVGRVSLRGVDVFAGRAMELDYKNEFLVARRDGAVVATCPDLITLVDAGTAEGVNAPDFARGQRVVVLGFACDPIWRTKAGLEVFSPRCFGYDIDYVPIEERLAALASP